MNLPIGYCHDPIVKKTESTVSPYSVIVSWVKKYPSGKIKAIIPIIIGAITNRVFKINDFLSFSVNNKIPKIPIKQLIPTHEKKVANFHSKPGRNDSERFIVPSIKSLNCSKKKSLKMKNTLAKAKNKNNNEKNSQYSFFVNLNRISKKNANNRK